MKKSVNFKSVFLLLLLFGVCFSRAQQLIKVGQAGDFKTIKEAYDAIPNPLSSNYKIEIQADYMVSNEIFPLEFLEKNTLTYSITITLSSNVAAMNLEGNPGSSQPLIVFNGADGITIDGSTGGLGGNRGLFIRNLNTSTPDAVITFKNGATENSIQYCNIEGEANTYNAGLVEFSTSATVGNSKNQIINNYFSDLTNGFNTSRRPGMAVYSYGSLGAVNRGLTIRDNEFASIWDGELNASFVVVLMEGTSECVVSGNHFYQKEADEYNNNDYFNGFILINGGGGYQVTGNYFGGTKTFAEGGQFVIKSGKDVFTFIYIGEETKGVKNIISDNKFKNLVYATQLNDESETSPLLSMIYVLSPAEIEVSKNDFGSQTAYGDISLKHDGIGGTGITCILHENSEGPNISVLDNTFGGFVVSGGYNAADFAFIDVYEGNLVLEGNRFGGTISNSVEQRAEGYFFGINNYSYSGMELRGNIFRNITHDAGIEDITLLYNRYGDMIIDKNDFENISSSSEGDVKMIYHLGDYLEISNNHFSGIYNKGSGLLSSLDIIYTTTSVGGFIHGNIIGGTSPYNIASSAAGPMSAIYLGGGTEVFACHNNIIQQFDMKNTSDEINLLRGIYVAGGRLYTKKNIIRNFRTSAGYTGNSLSAIVINVSNNLANELDGDSISNLLLTSNVSNTARLTAISINGGSGVIKNEIISNLFAQKNSPTLFCMGLHITANLGDWSVYNNVITLSNSNGVGGYQIRPVTLTGTTTRRINFYHNTVLLNSISGFSIYSGVNLWIEANGLYYIRNNVFQNKSTSTNSVSVAVRSATNYTNSIFSNNFLEVTQSTSVVFWGGALYTLPNWVTLKGTDSFGGTELFDSRGYANGNLVAAKGANLSSVVGVDRAGIVRSTTPWVGAYEGNNPVNSSPSIEPGAGYAIKLDGGGEYLSSSSGIAAATNFSMEGWFNVAEVGESMVLMYNGNTSTSGWGLYVEPSGELSILFGSVGLIKTAYFVEVGKWTHIALVRNNLTAVVYVNGIQVYVTSLAPNTPVGGFFVGGNNLGTENFKGQLDEIRLWNTALSLPEIRTWMCMKVRNNHPKRANLIQYYNFDEGIGYLAKDQSSGFHASFSTPMSDKNWALSGAAIGDTAANVYGVNLISFQAQGSNEQFTASNFEGVIDGMHIYYVSALANSSTLPTSMSWMDNNGYYGVFKVGNALATYDVVYNYESNSLINGVPTEKQARLVTRSSNADQNWVKQTGQLRTNTTTNTITLPSQTGTEYVIGFASSTYPKEPGSGYAMKMDGASYVRVPTNSSLNFVNGFSFECWLSPQGSSTNQVIFRKRNLAPLRGYEVILDNSGKLVFEGGNGTNNFMISSIQSLELGQWVHVAGVYNATAGRVNLYINGVLDISQVTFSNLDLSTFLQDLYIGAMDGTTSFYAGYLDELRLWNTVLTEAEIRNFICNKTLTTHPKFGDLHAYYRCDDGAGNALNDLVGGNDGVIVGSSWSYSGAYIGDNSVHTYGGVGALSLATASDGAMSLADVDSAHLYYVLDTVNYTTPPTGYKRLDQTAYWGIFEMDNVAPAMTITYDYTTNARVLAGEDSVKLVGRSSNANFSWGEPNTPITQNKLANTLSLTGTGLKAEIIPAFLLTIACDTSSAGGTWKWIGDVSEDWFNCDNWASGVLPGSTCDVEISAGATYQPIIKGGVGYCRSIKIETSLGANLTIDVTNGGALRIAP